MRSFWELVRLCPSRTTAHALPESSFLSHKRPVCVAWIQDISVPQGSENMLSAGAGLREKAPVNMTNSPYVRANLIQPESLDRRLVYGACDNKPVIPLKISESCPSLHA